MSRAEKMSDINELASAIVAARNVNAFEPSLENHLSLIELYMKADAVEQALQECIDGLIENKDSPDYIFALLTCLEQSGDYKSSNYYLEYLKTIIDVNDYDIEIENYDEEEESDGRPIAAQFSIVNKKEREESLLMRRVKKAIKDKEYDVAIKELETVDKNSKNYVNSLCYITEITENILKDKEKTAYYAKKVLEIDKDNAHALILLTEICEDVSEKKELYEKLKNAETFGYDDLYRHIAKIKSEDDIELCIDLLTVFLEKCPYDKFLMQLKAYLLYKEGKKNEAVDIYKKLNIVYEGKHNFPLYIEMLSDENFGNFETPLIMNTEFIAKKLTDFVMLLNTVKPENLVSIMRNNAKINALINWQVRSDSGNFHKEINNMFLSAGKDGLEYFKDYLKDVTVSEKYKYFALYEYILHENKEELHFVVNNILKTFKPIYAVVFNEYSQTLKRAYAGACSIAALICGDNYNKKLKTASVSLHFDIKRSGKNPKSEKCLTAMLIRYSTIPNQDKSVLLDFIGADKRMINKYEKELEANGN